MIGGLERYPTPLTPGLRIQLSATFRTNTADQDCTSTATWTSSNPAAVRPADQPGVFFTVASGDASIIASCSGASGAMGIRVERGGSAVSGRVIAAPDGPSVADAALKVGDAPPVRSDAAGYYSLAVDSALPAPLSVTAAGYQTRQTSLRGGEGRWLDIDLIGDDPVFPFALYRMMVRNGHESPAYIATAPLQRWTSPPNVYIWTTWKDTGLPVANVDWYVAEIRRVIPQLAGGRFEAGRIEHGVEQRPRTPGWINVQFHRSGNWAYVGANPGEVQFGADHTCNSYAVIHEFGHAMGYWHSNLVPSVMGGGPGSCTEINLSPPEQIVARTMYSRPRGNLDPDRDPPSSVMLDDLAAPSVRVTCNHILR